MPSCDSIYVRDTAQLQWFGHAIEPHRGKVLAYVFGCRKDEVTLQFKALLEPCGITRYDAVEPHVFAKNRHIDGIRAM